MTYDTTVLADGSIKDGQGEVRLTTVSVTLAIPVFCESQDNSGNKVMSRAGIVPAVIPTSTDRDYEGSYYLPISAHDNFPEISKFDLTDICTDVLNSICQEFNGYTIVDQPIANFEGWGYQCGLFCIQLKLSGVEDLYGVINSAQRSRDRWLNYRYVKDDYPLNSVLEKFLAHIGGNSRKLWLSEFSGKKVSPSYLIGIQIVDKNLDNLCIDFERLHISSNAQSYQPLGVSYCGGNNNFLFSVSEYNLGASIVLSYWKLTLVLFAIFYEVDEQVSNFFRTWRQAPKSDRVIRNEIRDVRKFASVFRSLLEDSTYRSLLDTEAEQKLLIGAMKIW